MTLSRGHHVLRFRCPLMNPQTGKLSRCPTLRVVNFLSFSLRLLWLTSYGVLRPKEEKTNNTVVVFSSFPSYTSSQQHHHHHHHSHSYFQTLNPNQQIYLVRFCSSLIIPSFFLYFRSVWFFRNTLFEPFCLSCGNGAVGDIKMYSVTHSLLVTENF